ncbi:MAG TPA: lamin tail domain-containing protein, partial [Candidatus Dormibacteraeota bacterium]|nr:lamin tail domain-containing protein [Candidatus Dormibacteraeota bacterium]
MNYPNTWLRVTRSGSTFTGYTGVDGTSWIQLGSVTISMSGTIYIGMAVSAAVTNGSSISNVTAQFREFMVNTSTGVATATPEVEPPGPSSRRTPIVITEIMYNPASSTNVLEFIEIYNSNPFFEDIGGYHIGGDIEYYFPAGTILRAGEYRVIARNPAHVQAAYNITGVWGPYLNGLKESGTVRLRNKEDAILLEVNYDNSPPWPVAADGAGHSLVLARPSFGEGYIQAWGQSEKVGGSPGAHDGIGSNPQRNVVINEFLANSDGTNVDYIELYNHSNVEVDMSGCTLSDDPHTNKFVFPPNTKIAANSFLVFYQGTLGFGLSSGGETIFLRSSDGTRVLDAVRYEAQAANVPSGRYPNGAKEIYPLTTQTPGAANAPILINDIVINEIMYKPISGSNEDEYVELYNKGASPVNIGGWRFTAGISYKFPTNTILAAGGYLVVARDMGRL